MEAEARKRQAHGQTAPGRTLTQQIAEALPRPREVVAEKLDTNREYVQAVKKIRSEAPELFEKIKSGDKTITQAKRELKEAGRSTDSAAT